MRSNVFFVAASSISPSSADMRSRGAAAAGGGGGGATGGGGGPPHATTQSEANASACREVRAIIRSPLQEPRGDHDALDLARPLVDLGDARVAVVTLDRELGGVAVAA